MSFLEIFDEASMSTEEEFVNEIYTIDASDGFLIFGGNNETLNIVYKGEWTNISDIFSDSIVFCKFFGYMKFFAVGLNSKIVVGYLSEKNEDLEIVSEKNMEIHGTSCRRVVEMGDNQPYSLFIRDIAHLQTDMTAFALKDDILVVGCEDGTISVVSESQKELITIQGTIERICQIEICNQYIIACTEREFMVFQGHFMIHRIEFDNITGFTVHDRNIYLMLPEKVLLCWFCPNEKYNQVDICEKNCSSLLSCFKRNDYQFNERLIQRKYEYKISHVEKVFQIKETIIFAGHGLKMITNNNEFSLDILDIIDIIQSKNIILFTTKNQNIFIGDYRGTSFSEFSSTVGSIYDLIVKKDLVYIAGEKGIDIMKINRTPSENGFTYVLQQ